MSGNATPSPTVAQFVMVLSNETGWYMLGVFMGVPTSELDTIDRNYGSDGRMRCLAEMYKYIESMSLPLSWQLIAEALKNTNNHSLAKKIHSEYILPTLQASPISGQDSRVGDFLPPKPSSPNKEHCSMEVIGDSPNGEETIGAISKEFISLSRQFSLLRSKVKYAFRNSNVDIEMMQDLIEDQCGIEPLPNAKATVDVVLKRIRQHYSILNLNVLIFLVENLLGSNEMLQKCMADYVQAVDQFKSSTRMIELVDLIKTKQTTTSKHKIMKLKVQEFWSQFTMDQFEKVMNEILETLYKLASQISVGKGCICVSWIIPSTDTTRLITLHPMEFLNTIGVISLHVGDVLVYDVPGEGPDTLEAAMLQAVHLKNRRAIELLLSVGADPQLLTTGKDDDISKKEEEIVCESESDKEAGRESPSDEEAEILKSKVTMNLRPEEGTELEDLHVPGKYMEFEQVGDVVQADLTISEPSLESEDHDIEIQITEEFWNEDTTMMLHCSLAAGLHEGTFRYNIPGFILISPLFYLNCETDQPVEVQLTVPHVLVTLSEDQLERIAIFSSSTSELSSYEECIEFNYLHTPDLIVDHHYAMFTTILHKLSYFVMGFASSTRGVSLLSPLPVVPLRCSLYVEYPTDSNDYITGSDVRVWVTLNLKTFELYRKSDQREDTKVERVDFILSEPEATVNGVLDNSPSDWLSLRVGHGVCQYKRIAYGGRYSHPYQYRTTTFVVQCLNSKEPLKFRVSVTSGDYELAEVSITTPSNLLSRDGTTKFEEDEYSRAILSEENIDTEPQKSMDNGVHSIESTVGPTRRLVPADCVSPDKFSAINGQYKEIPANSEKQSSSESGGYLDFKQVGDVVQADLTISEPSLKSEDHDIKIQITEEYWNEDTTKMLHCSLAAGLNNYGDPIPNFILTSPLFYLSCETDQPVEVQLTVPHVLVTLSKDVLERIVIFSSSTFELPGIVKMVGVNYLQTPDLIVDHHYAMFTTILHKLSYFVMGLASSTEVVSLLSPLPVAPLRCSLYVEYPANSNDYITGSDVDVFVTLNLKTVELYRKSDRRKDIKLERVDFTLSEPEATLDGVLDNSPSDWLSLREGYEVFEYNWIAYGNPHHFSTATFIVQCLNSKEPLKFRVYVTSGDYELAGVSITTPSNLLSKDGTTKFKEDEYSKVILSEENLDTEPQKSMDNGVHSSESVTVDPTRRLVLTDCVSPDQSSAINGQDKEIHVPANNNKQSSSESMDKDYESTVRVFNSSVNKDRLARNSSSLVSKHYPGMKMEITSNYWSQYPSDEVSCQLAVPRYLDCIWPSGYIFISQATYLSCETERPVDVKITLPHSLATSSENHSVTTVVFTATACFKEEKYVLIYSPQEFIPVEISDLTMDDDKLSFTTTVSGPSLFIVGVPISTVGVVPTPLPVVPLQCVASVFYPVYLYPYLRGTNIEVTISMDLERRQRGDNYIYFTLPGPVFSVNGTLETGSSSGWQSVRRGKALFHYDEIAFSEKWNKKYCNNPPRVETRFFVKCFDSREPLKFRVTVFCHNSNELVNKLLTPLEQTEDKSQTPVTQSSPA